MRKNNKNVIAKRSLLRSGNLARLDCFVIAFLAMTLIPSFANAQAVNVKVNGLVCSFCAVAIEKTFAKKGVTDVDVNLEDKYVSFTQPESGDLSDEEITQTITDAGYTVVEIEKADSE